MKQNLETIDDEETLQTTTCTPKHIDKVSQLKIEIIPCKVVMVKKPNGDGTHKKQGRVVVCGKGNVREHPFISKVENLNLANLIFWMGSRVMGCFGCVPLCPIDRKTRCLLLSSAGSGQIRTCETWDSVEVEKGIKRPSDISTCLGKGKR